MCLSIPKQVIDVNINTISLKTPFGQENAKTIVKVKKGDWVLTQEGVIIKKINRKEAKEINKLLKL